MTLSRRRTGWKSLLIVLLALAGAGQAGSYLHLVTVPHAVCAEHGDLADVAQPGMAALAACAPAGDTHPAFSVPHPVEPGDHHCLATAGRRESLTLATGEPAGPDQALDANGRPVVAASPRGPRSILRFAPKHSPPTA